MSKLFAACEGRTTTAIIFFSLVGTVFQFLHRLDATYISFVTIIMGYVLAHSVKEDLTQKDAK